MFWLRGDFRAGDALTLRMGIVAACVLLFAGCSTKLGSQVVDISGGARLASPAATDSVDARLLRPPGLPPTPSIPVPSSARAAENDVRPESLAPTLEAATGPPAPVELPGFIAADRVNLRPCPDQGAQCGPTATLRFNEEVFVLRLDQDDWAFVRVPRLSQDGYVLRIHVAPTRQSRPEGRSTNVSQPDLPQGRSRRDLPAAGKEKLQGGPREELIK